MSIRFKFRSSVNFDTIEIDGGKPYISVGELRSKILCQKKLSGICHKDFDLVFLDDLTGQGYFLILLVYLLLVFIFLSYKSSSVNCVGVQVQQNSVFSCIINWFRFFIFDSVFYF